MSRRTLMKGMLLAGSAPLLAACQSDIYPKHLKPLPSSLQVKMLRMEMRESDPIFMRIFKEEGELEVWKRGPGGRFMLLESYEICTWSGELGPKFQEGDRQAPEGFYTIRPAQMNPNSSFYLSFNLGFPNAFDRSHGRTGSHLMVHGACSSAGCYAMTDEQISDIYGLAREAFEGGQRAFQVHAFPFRMTPENMARHANHEHFPFWQMLQEGYQHFEITRIPPQVDVCDRRYIFNAEAAGQFSAAQACPEYRLRPDIELAFNAAQSEHQAAFEVALAEFQTDGFSVPPTRGAQQVLLAETPATPAPTVTAATAPSPVTAPIAAPVAPPTVEVAAPVATSPTPVAVAPVETIAVQTTPTNVVASPVPVETAGGTVTVDAVAVEPAGAAEPAQQNSFLARAGDLFDRLTPGN